LNQLGIRSILSLTADAHLESSPSSSFDFPLPDNTLDVLTMCDSALLRLLETQNDGGMVHEISRYPTIFPSLHSILCASAAALYLVGLANKEMGTETEDNVHLILQKQLREKLRMSAQKLVSIDQDHRSLHPSILCALRVLNYSDDNSSATYQQPTKSDVEKLLFLLKRNKM